MVEAEYAKCVPDWDPQEGEYFWIGHPQRVMGNVGRPNECCAWYDNKLRVAPFPLADAHDGLVVVHVFKCSADCPHRIRLFGEDAERRGRQVWHETLRLHWCAQFCSRQCHRKSEVKLTKELSHLEETEQWLEKAKSLVRQAETKAGRRSPGRASRSHGAASAPPRTTGT